MRLNRTSAWKVMTIWISRELSLLNFECLDILCSLIRHPCEKLWTLEFFEGIRCSISSVSIYYVLESYIRVKSYDQLNFSTGSVVQFCASQYIMRLNRTSLWKVMTIWNSREHIFLNFKRLDILCPRVVHSSEKLWPLQFLERFCCSILSVSIYYAPELDIHVKSFDHLNFFRASVVQFRASRYIMFRIRTSMWKVMTIEISRGHPLFHFKRLDILNPWIVHSCEKLWPFKFLESFCCSISSVSIYYVPESYIRVKSYDHLNFSRGFLFNFERLDILCAWIGHSCEK